MASCITTTTTTLRRPISSSSTLPLSTNSKIRAFTNSSTQLPSFPASSHALQWTSDKLIKKRRGLQVITRAGPPSTTSLIAAFVMPLTLIIATVFTSIRIADKLDEDFLEELIINGEIMEEGEGDGESSTLVDEKSEVPTWAEEKPAVPRTRNRPKREAQV